MTTFHFDAEPLPIADERQVIVPGGLASKAELLTFLQSALALPDYFGHNWDALEECLTDPDWLTGKALILMHQDIPLEKFPVERKIYLQVLAAVAQEAGQKFEVHFPEADRAAVMRVLGE